jgi:SpoIID/LytB domain protein
MPHPATLTSSFFKINVDSQNVYFVEGHGNGHGVGLCQWCSESRAAEGMRHEDIVLAAFPQAKLMRAY